LSRSNPSRSTGVFALDEILLGGFPIGGLVLIAGHPGSGKSIFSAQFLRDGALKGEKGIYASFAESKKDFFRNMKSLEMDFDELESKGLVRFLDFITLKEEFTLDMVQLALKEVADFGAERLVIDSISAIAQMIGAEKTRVLMHTIVGKIAKHLGVTVLMVAEIPYGDSNIGLGVEEFVSDGVIILRHSSEGGAKKRELEILKMRGLPISRHTYQFVIDSKTHGISLITPPFKFPMDVSRQKVNTGVPRLDEILHGGVHNGSITLIRGASGTGKTALGLQLLASGVIKPLKGLFISFDEPTGQIECLGDGLGLNLSKLVKEESVKIESYAPIGLTALEYYKLIEESVNKLQPSRLIIDNLTAIRYVVPRETFLQFARYVQLMVKERQIVAFITAQLGDIDYAGDDISTMADNIVSLRFREEKSRAPNRELLIVKTRGSVHDRHIVDFEITENGVVFHG